MENLFITFISLIHFHQSGFKDSNLTQFNFNFENDFIFQTDEYYTHSSKLEWIFFNKKDEYIYNFNIHQEMYTPSNHKEGYLSSTDMPYTGTFRVEYGIHKYNLNYLCSLDVGIGITGKYTYAKESMKIIHSILPTNPMYKGWDSQKKTALLLKISLRKKRRIFINKINNTDIILTYGTTLESLRSSLFTGVQLRYAFKILPNDFGFYSIYSGNLNYKDTVLNKYYYFSLGLTQYYIFTDETLRGLDMYHNQTILSGGFVYKYYNFNIGLLLNKETKRFKTQNNDTYGYGNILIGWSF